MVKKSKELPDAPAGVPYRGGNFRAVLTGLLDEQIITGKSSSKMQVREVLSRRLIRMAMDGSLPAIREVMDRTDGKAIERVREVDKDDNDVHQKKADTIRKLQTLLS